MILKALRLQKNLSQDEVAAAVGCASNTYSRYENESRQLPIELLIALANYYEVTTDEILGLSPVVNMERYHLSEIDEDAILSFKQLTKENKYIVIGKINELLKEQRDTNISLLKEAK